MNALPTCFIAVTSAIVSQDNAIMQCSGVPTFDACGKAIEVDCSSTNLLINKS
jgi:hypothetical protein